MRDFFNVAVGRTAKRRIQAMRTHTAQERGAHRHLAGGGANSGWVGSDAVTDNMALAGELELTVKPFALMQWVEEASALRDFAMSQKTLPRGAGRTQSRVDVTSETAQQAAADPCHPLHAVRMAGLATGHRGSHQSNFLKLDQQMSELVSDDSITSVYSHTADARFYRDLTLAFPFVVDFFADASPESRHAAAAVLNELRDFGMKPARIGDLIVPEDLASVAAWVSRPVLKEDDEENGDGTEATPKSLAERDALFVSEDGEEEALGLFQVRTRVPTAC